MLTKDKIIGIFCFIDDLLKTSNHNAIFPVKGYCEYNSIFG